MPPSAAIATFGRCSGSRPLPWPRLSLFSYFAYLLGGMQAEGRYVFDYAAERQRSRYVPLRSAACQGCLALLSRKSL